MNERLPVINLVLLLVKKNIYKQRREKNKPRIDVFLGELKRYYFIEKSIYQNQSKTASFKNKQRRENNKPRIDVFLGELKRYYFIEKSIYQNQLKTASFKNKWNTIMPWFEQ